MQQDSGSFRDPLSRVFINDDNVLRAFSQRGLEDIKEVWKKPFFQVLLKSGVLIDSQFVDPQLYGFTEPWVGAIVHPKLPFVSYPYEWTFSMLKDAALLQLHLTREALASEISVKDATAYNIQFVGSRPQFIDIGSFEVREKSDPWYGYRQFCELFLYPLMLQAYLGVGFQPFLRGSVNGIDPTTMRKLLPFKLSRRRKGRLIHVALHAAAQDRFADTEVQVKKEASKAGMNAAVLDATLKKLISVVENLSLGDRTSTWSGYSERDHYVESSLVEKKEFVRNALVHQHRSQVWDIGCNDGLFSRIAAAHSDYVVAMDADPLVVDRLYQTLREENNNKILPLHVDLSDAGGGIGWRGQERSGVFDRGKPDMVLYLAVIHHLAITFNIPIESQIELLAHIAPELVIEMPHADDSKVQKLIINKRDGVHDDFTLENFERLLTQKFDIRHKMKLASGTRTIFHAVRKP